MSDIPRITQDAIKQICKEHRDLYSTVEQNEKQFLNFRGYRKIENLSTLVNLRTLYLDSNMLDHVEGLECLLELRNQFLQNNRITNISGLSMCNKQDTLDLSQNEIADISSLSSLNCLHSLNLSNNKIQNIAALTNLSNQRDLNVSHNNISDFNDFVSVLLTTNVRSLICSNNPFYEDANVRKRLICKLPNLRFLNDRMVSMDERRVCLAWKRGGAEEERQERERTSILRKEKEDRMTKKSEFAPEMTGNNDTNEDNDNDDEDLPVLESVDVNDVEAVRRLGNTPMKLGGVAGLKQPSNISVVTDAHNTLHTRNVEYSVVNPVKIRNYKNDQFHDSLNQNTDYIAHDKTEQEGWVHGSEAKQSGSRWPEWLDEALLDIAEQCECVWNDVSEKVQARICARLRTQEDDSVDAASAYNSDECRLRYFELMFSDDDEDKEDEAPE